VWRFVHGEFDLSRPRLLGVINITPDSFFAGSRVAHPSSNADGDGSATASDPNAVGELAAHAAAAMHSAGAAGVDLGAESTRPGASRVHADEQITRLLPAVRAIRTLPGDLGRMPISIDTTLSRVAEAMLDEGADIINDVSAGAEDAELLRVAARRRAGLVLMHRLKPPNADSYSDRYVQTPVYNDVVAEVRAYLALRLRAALDAGVEQSRIVLDPGLGFGKSVEQNVELIRRTPELCELGRPVLSALSRKSFVGRVSLGRDSTPDERLAGTLAFSLLHVMSGASLLRVHDVAEHHQMLNAWAAAGTACVKQKNDGSGNKVPDPPVV
jgi:dihydropteroate synthase